MCELEQQKVKAVEADTWRHIWHVQRYLIQCQQELALRILTHDQSKLREPENVMFAQFTARLRGLTYGSDEYKATLGEMGAPLKHHYTHNRHHPEFYDDGIAGMSLIDLLEMVCDWMAAIKRHDDGDIRHSIEINAARFGITEPLLSIITHTVSRLQIMDGTEQLHDSQRWI